MRPGDPAHPIIAIGSGPAGIGRTWLAISLARALAAKGARVLLVDAGSGRTASQQLNCKSAHGLADLASGRLAPDEVVMPVSGGAGRGGFDLVLTGSGDQGRIAAAITALAFDYDRVLIDTNAGLDDLAIRLTSAADGLLLMAQNTPESLKEAYAFLKLSLTRRPDLAAALVVNRAASVDEAARVHGALDKATRGWLGRPLERAAAIAEGGVAEVSLLAAQLLDDSVFTSPQAA